MDHLPRSPGELRVERFGSTYGIGDAGTCQPASPCRRVAGANNRTHGVWFRADFLPAGIEKYLASGMIMAIGPIYAKKLARALARWSSMSSSSSASACRRSTAAKSIVAAWADQKAIRKILLAPNGVGTARGAHFQVPRR